MPAVLPPMFAVAGPEPVYSVSVRSTNSVPPVAEEISKLFKSMSGCAALPKAGFEVPVLTVISHWLPTGPE